MGAEARDEVVRAEKAADRAEAAAESGAMRTISPSNHQSPSSARAAGVGEAGPPTLQVLGNKSAAADQGRINVDAMDTRDSVGIQGDGVLRPSLMPSLMHENGKDRSALSPPGPQHSPVQSSEASVAGCGASVSGSAMSLQRRDSLDSCDVFIEASADE